MGDYVRMGKGYVVATESAGPAQMMSEQEAAFAAAKVAELQEANARAVAGQRETVGRGEQDLRAARAAHRESLQKFGLALGPGRWAETDASLADTGEVTRCNKALKAQRLYLARLGIETHDLEVMAKQAASRDPKVLAEIDKRLRIVPAAIMPRARAAEIRAEAEGRMNTVRL